MTQEDSRRPVELTPEEARQGRILLKKRWQKVVFFGGIVGGFLVCLLALAILT
ncbi:MAG: hypothetical protein ACREDZ_16965 [Kiloniellales bacterium]